MSVCAFAAQYDPNRADQDLNVQPDRIILDVVEIVFSMQVHELGPAAAQHDPECFQQNLSIH